MGGLRLLILALALFIWQPEDLAANRLSKLQSHQWQAALEMGPGTTELERLRWIRARIAMRQHKQAGLISEISLLHEHLERPWQSEIHFTLGCFYLADNQFEAAIDELELALAGDLTHADRLHGHLVLASSLLELERAEESWQQLQLVESQLTAQSPQACHVHYLSSLARYYLSRDDIERSLQKYLLLMPQLETLFDADDIEFVEPLERLSEIAIYQQRYSDAKSFSLRTEQIRTQQLGPKHPDLALSYDFLATIEFYQGAYDHARDYWVKALTLLESQLGEDDPELAVILSNLATVGLNLGDFADARSLYERAISIYERALGPDHSYVGTTLSNLGSLLRKMGDLEHALPALERALKIKEKTLGLNHRSTQASRYNVAVVLLDLNYQERGQELLEQNLKNSLPTSHTYAACLSSLGSIAMNKGDWKKAQTIFQESLQLHNDTLGPNHPYVSNLHYNLGQAAMSMGQFPLAARHHEQALSIRRESLGNDHPRVAESLVALARLRWLEKNERVAFELAYDAERIGRDHLILTIQELSEREALQYADVRFGGLDLAITASVFLSEPKYTKSTFEMVVESRALILDEMAARWRQATLAEDNLSLFQYRKVSSDLAKAMIELIDTKSKSLVERVQKLRDQRERIERTLGEGFTRHRPQASEILRELPVGASLVSYVIVSPLLEPSKKPQPHLYAFVLRDKNSEPKCWDLGAMAPLEKALHLFRSEMVRSATEPDGELRLGRIGRAIRKRIWDPFSKDLSQNVWLVPDGVLHLLSFSALPNGDDSYLGLDYSLHFMNAEKDLKATESRGTNKGFLVIGNPVLSEFEPVIGQSEPDCFAALKQFAPLPETGKEIRQLASLWESFRQDPVDMLEQESATETEFRKRSVGKSAVHVASHGFFLDGRCLTQDGRVGRGVSFLTPRFGIESERGRQLELSGLVFSHVGVEHSSGNSDGILTAEELATMDFKGIDLVVLSACDTGVGSLATNEGVFGLKRSLQLAGAKSVVLSQWSVDDEATRNFMLLFYRSWMAGNGVGESMRLARMNLIVNRRKLGLSTHPFYWAAFSAWGDWR